MNIAIVMVPREQCVSITYFLWNWQLLRPSLDFHTPNSSPKHQRTSSPAFYEEWCEPGPNSEDCVHHRRNQLLKERRQTDVSKGDGTIIDQYVYACSARQLHSAAKVCQINPCSAEGTVAENWFLSVWLFAVRFYPKRDPTNSDALELFPI